MNTDQAQKEVLLSGKLHRVMWKLAIPAIFAMVLYGLNAFMDTVYVGQLMNEAALAGIAIAYPLSSVLMGLGSWGGTGAANLLSVAIGENDTDTQKLVLANTTIFSFILSIIIAIPGYFLAIPLIKMMGGEGEVLRYGVEYLRITMVAAPFWVYGLALNFIVRGEGKMKEAAIMMAYGLMVNLILTPILITYTGLGVQGAAWSTNIGMIIYSIVGFRYFKTGKASFSVNIISFIYSKKVFNSIIKLGFPGFILTLMGLIQAIVVFNAIMKIGTDSNLAFFAASNRILLFLMTPLFGLMRALQPIVGVNYGAQKYTRVKDSYVLFAKTGLYILLPFWIILMLFPESTVRLVLPDLSISQADIRNFRIYMFPLPLLPFVFMSLTYLPAIKKPKYASIIGTARQLVFYVPAMLILPIYFGISGIYYGATIIDIVIAAWLIASVWKETNRLTDKDDDEKSRDGEVVLQELN